MADADETGHERLTELRDALLDVERDLAGRANHLGFQIRVWEKIDDPVEKLVWLQGLTSPLSVLVVAVEALVERIRAQADPRMEPTIGALAEVVHGTRFRRDLAQPLTLSGGVAAALSGPAWGTSSIEDRRKEAVRRGLDEWWTSAVEARACAAEVRRGLEARLG